MAITKQSWDLELDYGINFKDSAGYLIDKYTVTQAKTKYQYLWAWGYANGWTDAELMQLSEFVAAWNDVIWHGQNGSYTQQVGHGWNIKAPHGRFPINYPLVIASGEYVGSGSRPFYSDGDHGYGGTDLWVDHSRWMTGKSADRHIMRTSTWGAEGTYAYQECFKIERFRFWGNRPASGWMDASYLSSAIAAWDCGETSRISDVYVYQFNSDGLLFVRGTPVLCINTSIFMCGRSMVGMIGCAGATFTFIGISGDDSPTSFYARPGYGRESGCLLTVIGTKSETGISGQFTPFKAQMLLDAEGWVVAKFEGISLASGFVYPDSMIRVNHTINTSSVEVSGLRLWNNRRTILHDVANKKKWLFDRGTWTNPYHSFYWTPDNGGSLVTKGAYQPTFITATYPERLGHLLPDPTTGAPIGTWDDTNGYPRFSYTGPSSGSTGTITGISASASPNTVFEGSMATLTATVQGTGQFDQGVTWSIASGGGSLSSTAGSTAVYTSPQVTTDTTVVIRATASGDQAKTVDVQVTVKNVVVPTVTSVAISPVTASISSSQSVALTATVQGTGGFSTAVVWQIVSGGGTLTTGTTTATYVAPAVTTQQTAVIKATSVTDATKSATSTMTIAPVNTGGSITAVTVSSSSPTVTEGGTVTLTASVKGTGSFGNGVTWSIVSGGGTLNSTTSNPVVYTAPMVNSNTNAVIQATSTANISKSGTATIAVQDVPASSALNIDPNEMGVVINVDDPASQAIANEYVQRWGIPASNIVSVNLGNVDSTTTAIANTARQKTLSSLPSKVQWLALCFNKPSRVNGDNSITWMMTMGYSTISRNTTLPTSSIYGYTGRKPFTDKGVRPSMLVVSTALIQKARASHSKRPVGTCYMLAANDQGGQPRGRSRLTQMQALNGSTTYPGISFNYTSNLSGPQGENAANNILNKLDMLFYFNGMYKIYGMETNTVKAGAAGDYVTSTSGTLPDGAGQTPITYMVQNGFVGTMGTVIEPWQNSGPAGMSPGGLVEQFTNIQRFIPLYYEGRSLIDAYWKSIKWPTRSLFMGDPMVAPWGIDLGGTAPVLGCTDPNATNYDPNATINDGSCTYPASAVKWATSFDGTGPSLIATTGTNNIGPVEQWSNGAFANGSMTTNNLTCYPWALGSMSKLVLKGVTFLSEDSFNYTRINSNFVILPNGSIIFGLDGVDYQTGVSVAKGQRYDSLELIVPTAGINAVTTLLGGPIGTGSSCKMTLEALEVYG